jgi:hypothetical protein
MTTHFHGLVHKKVFLSLILTFFPHRKPLTRYVNDKIVLSTHLYRMGIMRKQPQLTNLIFKLLGISTSS